MPSKTNTQLPTHAHTAGRESGDCMGRWGLGITIRRLIRMAPRRDVAPQWAPTERQAYHFPGPCRLSGDDRHGATKRRQWPADGTGLAGTVYSAVSQCHRCRLTRHRLNGDDGRRGGNPGGRAPRRSSPPSRPVHPSFIIRHWRLNMELPHICDDDLNLNLVKVGAR